MTLNRSTYTGHICFHCYELLLKPVGWVYAYMASERNKPCPLCGMLSWCKGLERRLPQGGPSTSIPAST